MAKHALSQAADALAGGDHDRVCSTFARWRSSGERQLPWLAGPGLSALAQLRVAPPDDKDVQVLQRFLVGAEADPRSVTVAVEHDIDDPQPPDVPPDARAALIAAVRRYFTLLVDAYAALHDPVAAGDRDRADAVCEQWQDRLDDAAREIEERGRVVLGLWQPTLPAAPARRVRDHGGWALGFVVIALLIAAMMLWAVMQGWPFESLDFGI